MAAFFCSRRSTKFRYDLSSSYSFRASSLPTRVLSISHQCNKTWAIMESGTTSCIAFRTATPDLFFQSAVGTRTISGFYTPRTGINIRAIHLQKNPSRWKNVQPCSAAKEMQTYPCQAPHQLVEKTARRNTSPWVWLLLQRDAFSAAKRMKKKASPRKILP